MTLRGYQLRAIEEARAAVRNGARAPLIVSPTGSGKTTIGAAIVESAIAKGQRVLWLAHRKELVEQAVDRLTDFGLGVGAISASSTRAPNPYQPVQVASIQTLRARGLQPEASLVVFDEAHHMVSNDWHELARAYQRAVRIGFTATPERQDGRGLGHLFDALVTAATIRELTELGHLVPLDVVTPGEALRAGTIAQHPLDAYREHAIGARTVLFAEHVKAARSYLDAFLDAGIRATLVHGELQPGPRAAALKQHAEGAVLINVAVLTEGWDSPATECCILARGCGSPGLYIQIAGRVLRPAPGKSRALLVDLRGTCHVHGRPDEDREYSLEGRGIRRKGDDGGDDRFCMVCGCLLAGDATACAECGAAPAPLSPPTVTGQPLVKYAGKRREDDSARAATLARWIAEAKARGFKPGWAFAKYKAVYGENAPRAVSDAAMGRTAA